ncbi:MAG: uroporphyrinogen-III C-methyltransferase [Paucibacter sp.]|nr:uroporphyrinogen-III C-methyltransferase [Roseateles sp.]
MGQVIFVSAGPGAADLITLRGARALAKADVVLFDALTDPALREHAPKAQWIDVGKRGFCHSTAQAAINALLVRHAQSCAVVVRLKGGDASVFGRLEEEMQALTLAGIAFEVVPGVTAALAAAAQLQRPLTRRGLGRSVSLRTAMTREGQLVAAGPVSGDVLPHNDAADTEVYYMAGRQLPQMGAQLIAAGWPAQTPALVVSKAGCPDMASSDHTLATLDSASKLHQDRPALLIVGAGAMSIDGFPDRKALIDVHQHQVQGPSD